MEPNMNTIRKFFILAILLTCQSVLALTDPHLVIIRHGEGEHNINGVYNSNPNHPDYVPANLTQKGKEQAKKVAEMLLMYGFDNRNIAAVYVSPLPRTKQTAEIVAGIGVFGKDKIHYEPRLVESQAGNLEGSPHDDNLIKDSWAVSTDESLVTGAESNDQVKLRVLALYDEVAQKHKEGHVLFITHGMPAMELIGSLTRDQVRLTTGQAYMVPLSKRNNMS
jgi:broad specificity phosphatase PhoE